MISRSNLLEKYQQQNWFDQHYDHFEHALEHGRIGHSKIPGWLLVRTWCESCDEQATAIVYHGRRILLVASGSEQMGKAWVIHQCPHPYDIGPEEGQTEPTAEEEIDWSERQDIEQEMKSQSWPDDPEVRDGDGNIRTGGWND